MHLCLHPLLLVACATVSIHAILSSMHPLYPIIYQSIYPINIISIYPIKHAPTHLPLRQNDKSSFYLLRLCLCLLLLATSATALIHVLPIWA